MAIKLTTLKPLVATRSSEEKLKYAARRVDQIPSSRSEIDKISLAFQNCLDFFSLKVLPEIGLDSEKVLSSAVKSIDQNSYLLGFHGV